jgi:hypothetical protein
MMFNNRFFILIFLFIFFTSFLFSQPQTDVSIDRESSEIGFLDRQRSGIVLFSTGYRAIPSTTGINFDLLITPIVGEIYGKRDKDGDMTTTFANAGFAQLISLDLKYNFNTEKIKMPAISAGVLSTIALSWESEDDFNRPSFFYGIYAVGSKLYWRDKNARAHFGFMSDGYARGFSYFTEYYEPNKSFSLYAGTDIDLFNRFGFFLEITKPINDSQNPLMINLRIKNSLPLLTFTYLSTKEGYSIVGYMNLRLSLFPAITHTTSQKEKERFEKNKKIEEWDKQMEELEL